jgi:hypothetical protein
MRHCRASPSNWRHPPRVSESQRRSKMSLGCTDSEAAPSAEEVPSANWKWPENLTFHSQGRVRNDEVLVNARLREMRARESDLAGNRDSAPNVVGCASLRLDPAAALKAVQRGIEGTLSYLECGARDLAQALRNGPAVAGFEFERLENQQASVPCGSSTRSSDIRTCAGLNAAVAGRGMRPHDAGTGRLVLSSLVASDHGSHRPTPRHQHRRDCSQEDPAVRSTVWGREF